MVYNCASILKQLRVLHKSKFSIVEWTNAEQKVRYAQSVAISDVICALFEVGSSIWSTDLLSGAYLYLWS